MRERWSQLWPYVGFALIGIGLAFWQGLVYHHKTTGTVVTARVVDCQPDPVKGVVVTCRGTWVLDDHRVDGTIDGVDIPDMGRTVKARVHGGTAYAHRRLAAPAVFFFVGILMALGFLYAGWRNVLAPRRGAPQA
jgi:hypothetical protein